MKDQKNFDVLNDVIPEGIMNIVQEQDALRAKREEEKIEAEQKSELQRKSEYDETLLAFLDFIRPQLPNGWSRWISTPTYAENYNLLIVQIPGLAPIAMKWENKNDVPKLNGIGVPAAWESSQWDEIDWHWNYGESWKIKGGEVQSLLAEQYEEALWKAALEAERMKELIAKREERITESNSQFIAKQEQANQEDLMLFNLIKDDEIAVLLIKAFLAIRQERSMFESQVNDANETMYSIENRWLEKAAELRRQADNAERRASEEKYRLESDLSDAEEKLKKAKRAW